MNIRNQFSQINTATTPRNNVNNFRIILNYAVIINWTSILTNNNHLIPNIISRN